MAKSFRDDLAENQFKWQYYQVLKKIGGLRVIVENRKESSRLLRLLTYREIIWWSPNACPTSRN